MTTKGMDDEKGGAGFLIPASAVRGLAILFDRSLTILEANRLFPRADGGPGSDLRGKPVNSVFPPEYRDALAKHDRPAMRVLQAQIAQADAQLALIREELARTEIRAPFSGVVVSGDLSQKLGTPVEKGAVLFEVAPLDAYRVILEVDERDVLLVAPEQTGHLALAARADARLPFVVRKVTPVSTPEGGRNFFRVEAGLTESGAALRPGMEGVGKVVVGRERFAYIWTRSLLEWIRLQIWAWLP